MLPLDRSAIDIKMIQVETIVVSSLPADWGSKLKFPSILLVATPSFRFPMPAGRPMPLNRPFRVRH